MWGPTVNSQCSHLPKEQFVLHSLERKVQPVINHSRWEERFIFGSEIPVSSLFFPSFYSSYFSFSVNHHITTHPHTREPNFPTWSHERSVSLIPTDIVVIGFSSACLMNMDTHTHISGLVDMCIPTRTSDHPKTHTHTSVDIQDM